VATRHRLAGRWAEQSTPMFTSGKVSYEVGGYVEATPYGGLAAMHRLVTKLGLVEAINERLRLLKVHLPYHESDHVLNLAYNVLTGGTRLEDIERLRHDVAYMNAVGAQLIPDPTTAGDFCRRFAEPDVVALMDAVNAVRPKLWRTRGADLLGPVAYIDADGTIVPTTGSYKQGMDISYKGIWGYAPLILTLANTREVLFLVNRPGNAPSHQDAAEPSGPVIVHVWAGCWPHRSHSRTSTTFLAMIARLSDAVWTAPRIHCRPSHRPNIDHRYGHPHLGYPFARGGQVPDAR